MNQAPKPEQSPGRERFEAAYARERPRLVARIRAAGRSLEEAEDLAQDIFAETLERLPALDAVRSLPAWINALSGRRLIDAWRRDRTRRSAGETEIAEESLREIIAATGLDPLDGYVRENLVDALNDAIRLLPPDQRRVVEAQVFGGLSFRQIARTTGESIDTLTARKRYAVKNLSKALRHWIEE